MKVRYYLRGLGIGMIVTAILMGIATSGKTATMTDAEVIARAKELGMTDDSGTLAELAAESAEEESALSGNDVAVIDGEAAEVADADGATATEDGEATTDGDSADASDTAADSDTTDIVVYDVDTGEETVTTVSNEELESLSSTSSTSSTSTSSHTKAESTANSTSSTSASSTSASSTSASSASTSGKTVTITVNSGDGSRTVANKLVEAGVIDDAAAFDTYLCQNGYDKKITTGSHTISVGATDEEIAKALVSRQ